MMTAEVGWSSVRSRPARLCPGLASVNPDSEV